MPTFQFDFGEDDFEPESGSSFSDDAEISDVTSSKPLDGDKMTHREVDSLMDELGLPKQGRSSATINEKLFQIAEFMKENGEDIDIRYSKRGKVPKTKRKRRKPGPKPGSKRSKLAEPPKTKRRVKPQTKVPTLLGSLFGAETPLTDAQRKELTSIPSADLTKFSEEEKYEIAQRMSAGERLKDILDSKKKPKPKQPQLPMGSKGPKKSTVQRKKYFDARDERRAIAQFEGKLSGEDVEDYTPKQFNDPFFDAGNPPPPKPPAPPFSPGDDDGEDPDDDAALRGRKPSITQEALDPNEIKRREAQARRRQDFEADQRKKDLAAKRRREREDQAMAFKERRRQILAQSAEAQKQITQREGATTSDRIVRRLASFGIGRSLGGSGSLFAAAMEFGVFQPEEERNRLDFQNQREAARKDKEDALRQLELDKFNVKRNEDLESERIRRAIDEANLRKKGAKTLEEREEITRKLLQDLEPIPTATMIGGPPKSPAGGRGSGGSGGGTPPPGSSSSGPGGPGKFGKFLQTPAGLTAATLGALGITEGIGLIRDTAQRQVRTAGSILIINSQTQSGIQQTGAAAKEIVSSASRIGGAGAGALIGSTILPGAGTLIGAGIGGAVGTLADPIVEAINQGNQILERFTKNSLDSNTIATSATEEVATFLRKLEADESVSEQTVAFRQAQGELTRSIIGLQEKFIREFGDAFATIIRLLAKLVDYAALVVQFIPDILSSLAQQIPIFGQFVPVAKAMLSSISSIQDSIENALADDPSVAKDIEEFFSTQVQFMNAQGQNRFGNVVNNFGV